MSKYDNLEGQSRHPEKAESAATGGFAAVDLLEDLNRVLNEARAGASALPAEFGTVPVFDDSGDRANQPKGDKAEKAGDKRQVVPDSPEGKVKDMVKLLESGNLDEFHDYLKKNTVKGDATRKLLQSELGKRGVQIDSGTVLEDGRTVDAFVLTFDNINGTGKVSIYLEKEGGRKWATESNLGPSVEIQVADAVKSLKHFLNKKR